MRRRLALTVLLTVAAAVLVWALLVSIALALFLLDGQPAV